MAELVTFSSDVADPQPTPPRPARSIRRTSHVDIAYVDDDLHLSGACRDLFTGDLLTGESPAGQTTATLVAEATLIAELSRDHRLLRLAATGGDVDAGQLVDTLVGSGFRARLDAALPATATGSPLFVLLDELPVAAVISGYSRMYQAELGDQRGAAAHMADVCSGWRSEGLMIRSIKATGRMPIPFGPPAPPPETVDELAWHHLPTLAVGNMRRRRLIDLSPTPTGFEVFATFSDTHVNDDGVQRVLHEYTLIASVGAQGLITTSVATPRVLPWNECPHAAASAGRLVGTHPREIRSMMRGVRGLGTCTHLNDLLRSLGDLEVLIDARDDEDVTGSHAWRADR